MAQVRDKRGMGPIPGGRADADFIARFFDAAGLFLGSGQFPIMSPVESYIKMMINSFDQLNTNALKDSVKPMLWWFFLGHRSRVEKAFESAWYRVGIEQVSRYQQDFRRLFDAETKDLEDEKIRIELNRFCKSCGFPELE